MAAPALLYTTYQGTLVTSSTPAEILTTPDVNTYAVVGCFSLSNYGTASATYFIDKWDGTTAYGQVGGTLTAGSCVSLSMNPNLTNGQSFRITVTSDDTIDFRVDVNFSGYSVS